MIIEIKEKPLTLQEKKKEKYTDCKTILLLKLFTKVPALVPFLGSFK